MRRLKSIIRSEYSDIEYVRSLLSDEEFKKYVGVSISKYENKLAKIDTIIDPLSFNVASQSDGVSSFDWIKKENSVNQQIGILYSDYCVNNHLSLNVADQSVGVSSLDWINKTNSVNQQIGVLDSEYCTNDQPITYLGINNGFEETATQPWDHLSSIISEKYSPILFGKSTVDSSQNDCHLVRSLKEQYGDEWQIVYNKIIGLRFAFNLLLFIEKQLFQNQNNIFHSSPYLLWEYEYFDLRFTMKRQENYPQALFVNFLFYAIITSNNNEKKNFNRDTLLLK